MAIVWVGLLGQVHMHLRLRMEKGYEEGHQSPCVCAHCPACLASQLLCQLMCAVHLVASLVRTMERAVQRPTDSTRQHQDEMIVKPEPSGLRAHSSR